MAKKVVITQRFLEHLLKIEAAYKKLKKSSQSLK